MITPRAYQSAAIAAIEAAEVEGRRRQIVAMATGLGKTVVFAMLLRKRGGRSLVLAHRDELIEQAVDKLGTIWPEAFIGVVKAERNEILADTVVASVQTAWRPKRLESLYGFDTVIVDEVHHAAADSYRKVLEGVGSLGDDGPLTIGFTATPERGDGQALGEIFDGGIVYEKGILDGIREGYLCDIRARRVLLDVDFRNVRRNRGDFSESDLERLLEDADAPRHAADAYLEVAAGRKAILFTPTIASAHEMETEFRARGIAAEALSGETPMDERRAILRRFSSGETMVVANCAVLTEGFDEPSVDAIIMARPTMSRTLYIQMLGRGLRTYPNKRDCLVLDLVGNAERHDIVTLADIFEASQDELDKGGTVTEAVEAAQAAMDLPLRDGQIIVEDIDIWQRRAAMPSDRGFGWVTSDGSEFYLPAGDSTIAVVADAEGRWRVVDLNRQTAETIVGGLDFGYAQGWAEDEVRRRGAWALANTKAGWRERPASQKQLDALSRMKVRSPEGALTAGMASDLMTVEIARSRIRRMRR